MFLREKLITLLKKDSCYDKTNFLFEVIDFLRKYKEIFPLKNSDDSLFSVQDFNDLSYASIASVKSFATLWGCYNYNKTVIHIYFSQSSAWFLHELEMLKDLSFFQYESVELGFVEIDSNTHPDIFNFILEHFPNILIEGEEEITEEEQNKLMQNKLSNMS